MYQSLPNPFWVEFQKYTFVNLNSSFRTNISVLIHYKLPFLLHINWRICFNYFMHNFCTLCAFNISSYSLKNAFILLRHISRLSPKRKRENTKTRKREKAKTRKREISTTKTRDIYHENAKRRNQFNLAFSRFRGRDLAFSC